MTRTPSMEIEDGDKILVVRVTDHDDRRTGERNSSYDHGERKVLEIVEYVGYYKLDTEKDWNGNIVPRHGLIINNSGAWMRLRWDGPKTWGTSWAEWKYTETDIISLLHKTYNNGVIDGQDRP